VTVYDAGMDMDENDGWVDEWVIIESGSGKTFIIVISLMVHGQSYFRHRYSIFKHIQ
jgi:hypothetical protein